MFKYLFRVIDCTMALQYFPAAQSFSIPAIPHGWVVNPQGEFLYNTDKRYLYPYSVASVPGEEFSKLENDSRFKELIENPGNWSDIADLGENAQNIFGLKDRFQIDEKIKSLEATIEKLTKKKSPTPANIAKLARLNNQLNELRGFKLSAQSYLDLLQSTGEVKDYIKALNRKGRVTKDFRPAVRSMKVGDYIQKDRGIVEHGDDRLATYLTLLKDSPKAIYSSWNKLKNAVMMKVGSLPEVPDRRLLPDAKVAGDVSLEEMDVIQKLWKICYNSYRPNAQIVIDGAEVNYDMFQHDGENAGFVAQIKLPDGKYLYVISNRGTQNKAAMLEDALSTYTEPFYEYAGVKISPPVKITYAPAKRIKDMEPFITGWIQAWENQDPSEIENIIVTGHSLGGGTAEGLTTILANVLPPSLASKLAMVTFEGMRGLDTHTLMEQRRENPYLRDIDKYNSIRFLISTDIVPSLPLYATETSHLGRDAIVAGDDAIKFLNIIDAPDKTFNPSSGSHSMQPTTAAIELVKQMTENPDEWTKHIMETVKDKDLGFVTRMIQKLRGLPHDFIAKHVLDAYGMIKGRRKPRTTTVSTKRAGKKTSSSLMKAKMAYVRSFKKH